MRAEVRGTVAIHERPIIMGTSQTVKSFFRGMKRRKATPRRR